MGQYYKPTLKQKGAKNWQSYRPLDFDNGAKLMEHSYIGNSFVSYIKKLILRKKMQVVWAGDYADGEKGKMNLYGDERNLYDLSNTENPKDKSVSQEELAEMLYVVNHTKRQFVDYSKVEEDTYGFRIDPLPLLTAEGNGRGCGDYHGSNMRIIGSWARDFISVESFVPNGYTEIVPDFR